MAVEPIVEIEEWSQKLSPWRQDCLRRLAVSNDLTETDLLGLLAMIKHAAGFELDPPLPAAEPFTKAHFGGGKHQPVILKAISGVKNVNRLVDKAAITFCPKALTLVYGRNGSGKSGFVRILRTACRTRIENPSKLKVLSDVYGGSSGPQSAEIVIDAGTGDIPITWTSGMAASPQLAQIAVFDSPSAQLYVDGGHQIRYLPFGLALPHRLNTACLALKERLETERSIVVGNKIALTSIIFPVARATAAQSFNTGLSKDTSSDEIDKAASFKAEDQARLDDVSQILSAGTTASTDLAALITWVDLLASECEQVAKFLGDPAITTFASLRSSAVSTRQAVGVAAEEMFNDEPLPGVGGNAWRTMWAAARDYSVGDAYPDKAFPVISLESDKAACVLCQQPLESEGSARMQRFQKYMDDKLDLAATQAEAALNEAIEGIPELKLIREADFPDRLKQVRIRDAELADRISAFQTSALARHTEAKARLTSDISSPVPSLESPHADVQALCNKLKVEKAALEKANDELERTKLIAEKAELEDRKILAANHAKLGIRQKLLLADAGYAKALSEVNTKGITQRANELVDSHLTSAVIARFDAERSRFDITHLKIGLTRKSGQTKAEFDVDPQTKLTKVTSEILSEGEQRALALAGFLTEVALTDGSGPIVIDDPVSSLDRERSAKVAERLAEEACKRQVIVFTHDLVFFNEICRAAEKVSIDPVTVALFGDKHAAGKVDAAGVIWKGLNVAKRIARIKNDFAPLTKLYSSSPADYEYQIKNLYGRLRDTYERAVEEVIFKDVVQRGTDAIQTKLLRYVTLSDALAIRFHDGMTRASTHSHDNPAAATVSAPNPTDFADDIAALEKLVADLKADHAVAEKARPQMK